MVAHAHSDRSLSSVGPVAGDRRLRGLGSVDRGAGRLVAVDATRTRQGRGEGDRTVREITGARNGGRVDGGPLDCFVGASRTQVGRVRWWSHRGRVRVDAAAVQAEQVVRLMRTVDEGICAANELMDRVTARLDEAVSRKDKQ